MDWTRLLKWMLLPPAVLIWSGLIGILLVGFHFRGFRFRRSGVTLLTISLLSLYVLSTPVAQSLLLNGLDRYPALDLGASPPPARAVVILGAGRPRLSPEYNQRTVGHLSLERLRYGAWLHRHLGLPVLVSSGIDARAMAEILKEFHTPVEWVDIYSGNTHQNAQNSAALLEKAGITRIYLVTHFWHMPRAVAAFEFAGLQVIPAPTGFWERSLSVDLAGLLPRAEALYYSEKAIYEYMGRVWYQFRYGYGWLEKPSPTASQNHARSKRRDAEC